MTTWPDLVAYIRREYQVEEEATDELRILFEYEDDDRDQIILIYREIAGRNEEWVQVASVCGPADDVDLRALLEEIGSTTVVCGAVIMNDHVVLRHALPLENLDLNEFIEPLHFVADTADYLEEKFFGEDEY